MVELLPSGRFCSLTSRFLRVSASVIFRSVAFNESGCPGSPAMSRFPFSTPAHQCCAEVKLTPSKGGSTRSHSAPVTDCGLRHQQLNDFTSLFRLARFTIRTIPGLFESLTRVASSEPWNLSHRLKIQHADHSTRRSRKSVHIVGRLMLKTKPGRDRHHTEGAVAQSSSRCLKIRRVRCAVQPMFQRVSGQSHITLLAPRIGGRSLLRTTHVPSNEDSVIRLSLIKEDVEIDSRSC